jgi:hypothetical protein
MADGPIIPAGRPAGPLATHPLAGTSGFLWTFRVCVYGLLLVAFVLGGTMLRICVVLAALLAALSDRAGAIRHLVHLSGLALVMTLAPVFGVPLGCHLAGVLGMPVPLGVLVGTGLTGVLALIVTSVIGRSLTRGTRRSRFAHVLNRTLGSLIGTGEGLLLGVVLCWVLSLLGPAIYLCSVSLKNSHPTLARALSDLDALRLDVISDPLGRQIAGANPLARIPVVTTLVAAAEITADRRLFWTAYNEGLFEELLEDPAIRPHIEAFRADPAMMRAVEARDVEAIMSSTHLARALADDELCNAVAGKWPDVRRRIADSEIARARQIAAALDGSARTRYEQAVRRAEEFGLRIY